MDDKTDRLSDKGKNEFLENVVVAEADHIPGEENIDEAKVRPRPFQLVSLRPSSTH
jgi:hypothetical protein